MSVDSPTGQPQLVLPATMCLPALVLFNRLTNSVAWMDTYDIHTRDDKILPLTEFIEVYKVQFLYFFQLLKV